MEQIAPSKQDRSMGDLLGDLTKDIISLVRQEMTLAKAEMSQKVGHISRQCGLLAAGGALAYAGVLAVVAALVMLVAKAGLPLWAAALLVGVVVAAVGGWLVKTALDGIRSEDLMPRQTLETLKEIPHG